MTLVLGDLHRDHRQLLDLPVHRLTHRDLLRSREHAPTLTVIGPMLDHLIDCPRRQQRPALAFMPRLGTSLATGKILATPRCAAR